MPKEVKVMISSCPMIWSEVKCTPIQAFVMPMSFIDELKLILVPFLKWESSPMCFISKKFFFQSQNPKLKNEDIPKKFKWWMKLYIKLIIKFSYDLKWSQAYSYASSCHADIIYRCAKANNGAFLEVGIKSMLSIYKEVLFFNTPSQNRGLVFSNQRRKMRNRIWHFMQPTWLRRILKYYLAICIAKIYYSKDISVG